MNNGTGGLESETQSMLGDIQVHHTQICTTPSHTHTHTCRLSGGILSTTVPQYPSTRLGRYCPVETVQQTIKVRIKQSDR